MFWNSNCNVVWTAVPAYTANQCGLFHDDVITWKHFPRYWPFVQGIHRSPVNSPHKGKWRRALMFSWSAPWVHGWVNTGEAGNLRRVIGWQSVDISGQQSHISPLWDFARSSGKTYHRWLNMGADVPRVSAHVTVIYFIFLMCDT